MDGVQFEENNNYNNMTQKRKGFLLSEFLVQKGFAKDEKQANVILLSVVIIFLSISVFLLVKSLSDKQNTQVDIEISDDVLNRLPIEAQETIINLRN